MDDEPVKIIKIWHCHDAFVMDLAIVHLSCGHKCHVWEPYKVQELKVCPVCRRRIDHG